MLKILSPTGEVFPYIENAKKYLRAGADANVADYFVEVRNPQVPVQIVWDYSGKKAQKFLVEYATREDFADGISVEVSGETRSLDVYNLYKASNYFMRITAFDKDGRVLERAFGEFQTTSLGPRVMNFDGICNVRDFGGYETMDGKKIVQGIAYRGGSVTPLPRNPLDTTIMRLRAAFHSVSI